MTSFVKRLTLALAAIALFCGIQSASAAGPDDTLVLELATGKVTIELRPDLAPNHVARIKELVRKGFYDGTPFHRVIDGFMAQGGDPTGTGTGGSGTKLRAEFTGEPFVRGVVGMARSASPDSAPGRSPGVTSLTAPACMNGAGSALAMRARAAAAAPGTTTSQNRTSGSGNLHPGLGAITMATHEHAPKCRDICSASPTPPAPHHSSPPPDNRRSRERRARSAGSRWSPSPPRRPGARRRGRRRPHPN